MADESKTKAENGFSKDVAGKGALDDEMLPNRGEPVPQQDAPGEPDRSPVGGGDIAPESAAGLEKRPKEEE